MMKRASVCLGCVDHVTLKRKRTSVVLIMNMSHHPLHYRDPKVREERKERLARQELQDLLVPKDPPETMVQRATL